MSQNYKLRFDQLKENNPTQSDQNTTTSESAYYPQTGFTRNLCLVWEDGKKAFFNYAYLVSAEFEPGEEKNIITLHFSSHVIKLYGYMLESLYQGLFEHLPRMIYLMDERYASKEESIVINIIVEKADK